MGIKDRIRNYIITENQIDSNELTDETLLFEQGIFDSIGLLLLIEYIKDEFNVVTKDDELVLDNFESVHSISSFISNRL